MAVATGDTRAEYLIAGIWLHDWSHFLNPHQHDDNRTNFIAMLAYSAQIVEDTLSKDTEKKKSTPTPLYALDRLECWMDITEVDPRETYDSWQAFVDAAGYESAVIDGSPLLHWVWRRPAMERGDDLGEIKADSIYSTDEHKRDTLFLYYFQTKYETAKPELVVFKITVTRADEPAIRVFIREHFAKPFDSD